MLRSVLLVMILAALVNQPVMAQVDDTIIFTDASSYNIQQITLAGKDEHTVVGPLPLNELAFEPGATMIYGAANDNTIRRITFDGSEVETLVTGLDRPSGLKLDIAHAKMVWIDVNGQEIRRANLDGSNMQTVVPNSAVGEINSIALDTINGKLYWIESDTLIRRANLDGSGIETLHTTEGGVNPELECLVLDTTNSNLYWIHDGGSSVNFIGRSKLDGSDAEQLIPLDSFPDVSCLALDEAAGLMYWSDGDDETIKQAKLDGSEIKSIVTGLRISVQVQLGGDGKIYWAESPANFTMTVMRANLDGTQVETVVDDNLTLISLLVNPSNQKLYWLNRNTSLVLGSSNFDGSEREKLFVAATNLSGIALDAENEKLYWAESSFVRRSNLDGSQIEDVVMDQAFANAIALDLVNSTVYWSNESVDKIMRANLDGSGMIEIFSHPGGSTASMYGIAVDAAAGKMYWSSSVFQGGVYDGRIWQANLDGSAPESLITGLKSPRGIAIDFTMGKIYWADAVAKKIQRANLDGGDIEDLVITGINLPYGLVVNAANQHMYWADFGDGTISRSDLDGTNVTPVYTGPSAPLFLVVVESANGGGETGSELLIPSLFK